MKIVASFEINKDNIRFIDVDRLVQSLASDIINTLIKEKDISMSETGGSKNPEALDLVITYDKVIDTIEVRKWSNG